jgi:excinuclease UvrABC nuclease subunit
VAHNDAFYRSLGLAPETTSPTAKKEYANTIRNIKYFFEGRTREIVNMLKQEMAVAVKNRNFEKAAVVRNTLYALEHIQDVALIKADRSDRDESISEQAEVCRIEAYDIAHMTGKNVVGVMTVVQDGELNKAEYRKFKLSSEINDDVGNLKEILTRRFAHPEWRLPDMIVVDGGVGQKHVAEKVMRIFSETSVAQNSSGQDSIKNILIVSVVKDEHHKPKDILGFEEMYKEMSASDVQKTKAAILLANAEAHRFAIAYHRLRRRKNQFGQ